MNKTSDSRLKINRKWEVNNTDSIRFRVPKGDREIIRKCAEKNGESINSMLYRLTKQEVDRVLSKKDRDSFK